MKAKKENKVYSITTEQEKQRYLKEGYDIYSDNGVLLEYSPQKKISYSQYDALLKENSVLKEENEILREKLESVDAGAVNTAQDKPENDQEAKTSKTSGKKAGG